MTKRISDTLVGEVYEACKIMQDESEPITNKVLLKKFFDGYHITSVSIATKLLCDTGKLVKQKKGREFLYLPADYGQRPSPEPPSDVPDGRPAYWVDHLNETVQALEDLQAAIPRLLAGLLDLSRNAGRLSRIREILSEAKDLMRRNV